MTSAITRAEEEFEAIRDVDVLDCPLCGELIRPWPGVRLALCPDCGARVLADMGLLEQLSGAAASPAPG